MRCKIMGILSVLMGLAMPVCADVAPDVDTPTNRTILKQVAEAYNDIRTIRADFAQFNSKVKDELQTGDFYMSKPGKMRLVYEKGSPLAFYATDGYLIYHDKQAQEVSYFELAQTPVNIILKQEIRFDDPEFLVTDVQDVLDEYRVTVEKKQAPELGSITLIIDKDALMLKQWEVLDMQGIRSTVSLYNIQKNIPVDKSIFMFQNPYQESKK